jgi:hypothetical protein
MNPESIELIKVVVEEVDGKVRFCLRFNSRCVSIIPEDAYRVKAALDEALKQYEDDKQQS